MQRRVLERRHGRSTLAAPRLGPTRRWTERRLGERDADASHAATGGRLPSTTVTEAPRPARVALQNKWRLSGRTNSETTETKHRIRRTTRDALTSNVRSDAAAGYAADYIVAANPAVMPIAPIAAPTLVATPVRRDLIQPLKPKLSRSA